MWLNLVFHDIAPTNSVARRPYTVSPSFYYEFQKHLLQQLPQWPVPLGGVRFYFDDNLASFAGEVLEHGLDRRIQYCLAIPIDTIGRPGHLTERSLRAIGGRSVRLLPHGVQHVGLAHYEGERLLRTAAGGPYSPSEAGRARALTEREVAYQLCESQRYFADTFGPVDEFVLPYGLYNTDTVAINTATAGYRFLATCAGAPDTGGVLRSRILIESITAPETIVANLAALSGGEQRNT